MNFSWSVLLLDFVLLLRDRVVGIARQYMYLNFWFDSLYNHVILAELMMVGSGKLMVGHKP